MKLQGAHPAIPTQVAVDKLTTESNSNSNSIKNKSLMKAKRDIRITTFSVRTIKKESTISELIASAIATNHDIICQQEHRLIHERVDTMERSIGDWRLITCSAWKNNINAATGGIIILLKKLSYNVLANIDIVSIRIMIVNFNGNQQTSIIVCYSPTNVCDPQEQFQNTIF